MMIYYLIDDKTRRCYGFADQMPGPVDGTTIFGSDKMVDNPHDYVLKDSTMVYDPPKEVEA